MRKVRWRNQESSCQEERSREIKADSNRERIGERHERMMCS